MTKAARWAELDTDFQLADIVGGDPFAMLRREASSPWMITAGHAVSHLDERGRTWPADRATGGLALALHEFSEVRALVTAGRWDIDPDSVPGYLCPFKSLLLEDVCPTMLLDIHEGDLQYDVRVDTGSRPELSRALVNVAESAARREGLSFAVRSSLPLPGRERVLDATQDQDILSLRVSVSPKLLDPWTAPEQAERILAFFKTLLTTRSS